MKRTPRLWTDTTLLARILVVSLLASYQGCGGGGGGGGAPAPVAAGNVEIALADSPSATLQEMLLNVVSVRFNPSTNLQISETDKKWETVLPQPPSSGLSPNEAIIDLNSLVMQAQIFNTGPLKPGNFGQVELVLDPIAPGSVIPVCSPAVPGEGCIKYPMKLQNPGTNLRAPISLIVKNNQLSMLVLDITPTIVSIPADSNGFYTINPTMTVAPFDNFMATVSGTVVKGARGEKITAEVGGTNQIATTVKTQPNGTFTLGLPAVAAGTAYDFLASGTNTSFFPLANQVLVPGATSLGNLTPSSPHPAAVLSGTIVDKCTGLGIDGATLDVLTPGINDAGADCTKTPPTGCVVAASGATTAGGTYPVPPVNPATRPPFNAIATGTGTKYTLRIEASGYDTLITPLDASTTTLKCTGSGAPDDKCNFSLTRGTINGNVTLAAVNNGAALDVLVVAEESNTSNIAGVTTVTIPNGSISTPFTLLVPTTNTMAAIDLFTTAVDAFGGKPESATGHAIAVMQGVASPNAGTACATPVNLGSDLGPIACEGHGSVSGTANSFDQNTMIVLSKGGVQLMQSQVSAVGEYNFCAPVDTYKLQRFENGMPVVLSTTVTLKSQPPIPTPCSSICDTGTPNTCFLCTNTPSIVVP